MRKYGREDVDYETWYSPWMKQLALNYTRKELERRIHVSQAEIGRAHV